MFEPFKQPGMCSQGWQICYVQYPMTMPPGVDY